MTDPCVTRIADLLNRYETEVLPRKKGRTDGYLLARIKGDPLAAMDPSEIRPSDIKDFRDRRAGQTTPGQARRELVLLSHVFSTALSEWDLRRADNPVMKVKKPPAGKARDRRLSHEEWQRFWAEVERCRSIWFKPLVRLALTTAMRKSELLKIQWLNVRDHSTINRAVAINGKTGRRTVPLSREAQEVLTEWLHTDIDGGLGRVFKVNENAVNLVFRRVCDRAHIGNFRFHDLRHEAISRYMERGDLTPQEVMTISGHKTLAMLSRYTHLRVKDLADRL